jgi:hypothetical protein
MPVHMSEKEFKASGLGGSAPEPKAPRAPRQPSVITHTHYHEARQPAPKTVTSERHPVGTPWGHVKKARNSLGSVALPAPVDPAANYWNFTALTLIALFIVYIVKKGTLDTWASILFYQVAKIPSVENPTPNVPDIQSGQTPMGVPSPGLIGVCGKYPLRCNSVNVVSMPLFGPSGNIPSFGPAAPFAHQFEAEASCRENKRVILADDMGVGKTLPAILASEGRTIVICPATTKGNWRREILRAKPDARVLILSGRIDRDFIVLLEPEIDFIILNYDIVDGWSQSLLDWRPDPCICDEAHSSPSEGYVMSGGGASIGWDGREGLLLTASYPKNSNTWEGTGKDHIKSDSGYIEVYCIGLKVVDAP